METSTYSILAMKKARNSFHFKLLTATKRLNWQVNLSCSHNILSRKTNLEFSEFSTDSQLLSSIYLSFCLNIIVFPLKMIWLIRKCLQILKSFFLKKFTKEQEIEPWMACKINYLNQNWLTHKTQIINKNQNHLLCESWDQWPSRFYCET